MTTGPTSETLDDVEAVRPGDIVREAGTSAWCVAVAHEDPGPDGVRQVSGGVGLEITLSVESLRRAAFGELPARVLVARTVAGGPEIRTAGPVERMLDPLPWLRVQPTSPHVIGLVALHASQDHRPAERALALRALEEFLHGLE